MSKAFKCKPHRERYHFTLPAKSIWLQVTVKVTGGIPQNLDLRKWMMPEPVEFWSDRLAAHEH